ncbi:MAG: hypothetical protein LBU32_14300 [Clostridiales bacterium]|jgi:hypothetical protein|nr:hypothetical protein [Clostridiales bacterium]
MKIVMPSIGADIIRCVNSELSRLTLRFQSIAPIAEVDYLLALIFLNA